MRGRDYDWHRELLEAKAMNVITNKPTTRREKRRAEDRHESGFALAVIGLVCLLTYLFFFH